MGNKEIKEENGNGFEEDVCSKFKKKKKNQKATPSAKS